MVVTRGVVVSVEYTLRLDDHQVVESNIGDVPLTYTHGSHEIIPGLEKGLEGMSVGESKLVTVNPVEGYGEMQPEGFFEVSKDRIPIEALIVGTKLEAQAPDGTPVYPRVAEIREDTVVLNLNHPLAGQTLHFEVKVLDIQEQVE